MNGRRHSMARTHINPQLTASSLIVTFSARREQTKWNAVTVEERPLSEEEVWREMLTVKEVAIVCRAVPRDPRRRRLPIHGGARRSSRPSLSTRANAPRVGAVGMCLRMAAIVRQSSETEGSPGRSIEKGRG